MRNSAAAFRFGNDRSVPARGAALGPGEGPTGRLAARHALKGRTPGDFRIRDRRNKPKRTWEEQTGRNNGTAASAAERRLVWHRGAGPVGLVTISLARNHGKARTKGFRDALKENGDIKEVALDQMQRYTADETFK